MNQINEPGGLLPDLFHHRWAVPALAALEVLGGGAKFVTLQKKLGVGRDSLVRTLKALMSTGQVMRNPGYGHPMRPEYIMTPSGHRIASACLLLVKKLQRLDIGEVALNKWSLPVLYALSRTGGRFNRLRDTLEGITPRALTLALRDLQAAGLVERLLVDADPPRTEYRLSRKGRGLADVILKIAEAM